MTILDALQSASVRLLGQKPASFFASQRKEQIELVDLINEAAVDICRYHDWQALLAAASFAGDGVKSAFDMPAGYDRMTLSSDMQDKKNWVWGYQHVPSFNDFMMSQRDGFYGYPGIWTIYANQFNFYPAPADGKETTFPYVSKNYAMDADEVTTKPQFTADTDTFRINGGERLLTLWLVWRWRENKKMDSTGDQENFAKAIGELAAKDRGSRVYRSNNYSYGGSRGLAPFPF